MKTVGIFLSFFLGITSTFSSTVVKTDLGYTEQLIASNQQADSFSLMERFVDSRFKLLAADFQEQIDDLKGKVVRLEGTKEKTTTRGVNKYRKEHEIQKRQANGRTRTVCENSSSFCTYFHPDHPDAGRKRGNYTPTATNSTIEGLPNVNGIPTSCGDLQQIGHKLSGLYLIKAPRPNQQVKIETVFCNFTTTATAPDFQKSIGILDVKTKSVHFYVQRRSIFNTAYAVIPFEYARLNTGNSFDLTSGIFTAPVSGIYHFDFYAQKDTDSPYLSIFLQVNGESVARTFLGSGSTGMFDTAFLTASLRLRVNDKVTLYNVQSILHENPDLGLSPLNSFAGWLVEEDF